MSEELITCIGCPIGCRLKVHVENGTVKSIDGAECARGKSYAAQECTAPTRMITSLVKVAGRRKPLSVKSAQPVPKEAIFECVAALHSLTVTPPVRFGDVLLPNVCGTGVDIVATGEC